MEEPRQLNQKIVNNSFWNFLTTLLGKIGALLFVVILARFLLPEKFGIYSLVMSVTLILITFADIGINQALIRYLSEWLAEKNREKTASVYHYLFRLKFFLSLFLAIVLLALSYPLSFYLFEKPLLFYPLIFSSIYLFIYSIESFYSSLFFVVGKLNYLAIRQFLWEALRILGSLFVFIFLVSKYSVVGIINVLIIAVIITLIFLLYNLRKFLPFLFRSRFKLLDKRYRKHINKILFYLSVGGTLSIIFGYVDIVMIGMFLPSASVGFYSASMALAMGFGALLTITNILLPVFTQMKKERFNEMLNKVFKYTSLLAVPTISGLFIFGNYIVITIYGVDYLPAVLPLYFLAFLVLETPLSNSFKSLFTATEKPRYFVNILIISTIMNIVLNYFLITSFLKISPDWALAGAAISTLASRYFYLIGLSFYARKKLGISIRYSFLIKPILASMTMVAVLYSINLNLKEMNFFIGISEIFFGALFYFAMMFIIKGISKDDLLILRKIDFN